MNLKTDSLWIGAFIHERLEDIAPCYPCVATEGAPSEFAVYRRAGYSGRDTKDRYNCEETINLVISVAARSYVRSIELAQGIKDRLDGLRGRWRDKAIDSLVMTNAVEEYSEEAYVQHLYFSLQLRF